MSAHPRVLPPLSSTPASFPTLSGPPSSRHAPLPAHGVLGRVQVSPWSQETWDRVVLVVAEEACTQKFSKVRGLRNVLLRTGGRVLAEATSRDSIWGIGIDGSDPHARVPAKWKGSNILGWALMRARDRLSSTPPTSVSPAQPSPATPERRVDGTDGVAYTLDSFVEVYGGTRARPPQEWANAKRVGAARPPQSSRARAASARPVVGPKPDAHEGLGT